MKPLKPVMAALLAASSVVFALPGISQAITPQSSANKGGAPSSAPVKPAATCPPADSETNPINILTCIVATNADARKDIGDRFLRFVQSKDSTGQFTYLTKDFLSETGAPLMTNVAAAVQKWPDAQAAQNKPGDVAALYFVAGPDGAQPAWAAGDPILSKTLGDKWLSRLQLGLAKNFTNPPKIAPNSPPSALDDFLRAAAAESWAVFAEKRTKDAIRESIKQNDTTAPVTPETPGPGKNPLDSTGSGFGYDDLYIKGAVVANVWGPNDKDKGYRTLSMKIYTSREETTGQLINRIGIVDITQGDNNNPSLPQFVNLSPGDGTSVIFRDGGRKYTVSVGANGDVTLKRADAKDDSGALATSLSELSGKRDAQIRSSGVASFGGQSFYVLGQGGAHGSVMFFPTDASGDASGGGIHPVLMGDVTQVLSDGSTGLVSHPDGSEAKPNIGKLPPKGDAYHLEFDRSKGMWKVVAGPGDAVAPPKDSKDPAKDPGKGQTGSTDPANPAGPTNPAPAPAPKSLDEAVAALKAAGWAEEGNTAENSSKLRILSKTTNSIKSFSVAFDPSFGVTDNQITFLPMNGNIRLLSVRGVKGYVMLGYSTGDTQYYDAPNFAKYVQHMSDASVSYDMAGSYVASNKQMQGVTNVEVAVDILVLSLKVKSNDPMLQTIRDRVKKNAKDSGYVINGDLKALVLGFGENGKTIWPEEKAAGDTGSNVGMTGLRGPGTAVALTGSVATGFKDTLDMGGGHTATLLKPAEKDIALYSGTEDEIVGSDVVPDTKVWYVMVGYKQGGKESRSKALAVFGGKDRLSLPVGYHMQGLDGVDVPTTTQFMLLHGSTQEKGAIAAYRYVLPDAQGGSNAKDKKGNCAGPLIWWGGLTKAEVQTACDGDSKVP